MSYFSNVCPQCQKAPIFNGIWGMNKKCLECGNVFEKEEGYFIGAMIASYFLGFFLAVPTLVISYFLFQVEMWVSIVMAASQLVLLQPILFRYSRIIWIQIEARVTREMHK